MQFNFFAATNIWNIFLENYRFCRKSGNDAYITTHCVWKSTSDSPLSIIIFIIIFTTLYTLTFILRRDFLIAIAYIFAD